MDPSSCLLSAVLAVAIAALSCSASAADSITSRHVARHLCKPQEVVGFSCELTSQRVISLCGSPGFNKFQGKAEDNPGYAYVAIGTRKGQVQFRHPENPQDYKRFMTQTVSVSAQQNMFVMTDKGAFLQFAMGRDVEANDQLAITASKAPTGWWSQGASASEPSCVHRHKDDHLGSFMSQMVDDPEWVKLRGKTP
ncbi:hypothetical protein [Hydrogenophaga sp. MI9]|uniref:hypothetical protein n=1 Tax=Hydrogenophaga sp. MI9 TaxID=3453719 RepID=UPI003EEB41CA